MASSSTTPTLQIHDSFAKTKVAFEPLVPGQVGMYLCGPTVYDSPHLGHARSAVAFDAIRRYLEWRGFKVTFVRNVTDVDDKIIQRAAERDASPGDIATKYSDEYDREMGALGVKLPDVKPQVTTHMAEIIALVERLVASGAAYAADGDVYFSVSSFAPYGKLSGQTLDMLQAGARVEPGERKRDPMDFALWKAAKPGEPRWPSPWGEGRPGWHIECSAMSEKHLGQTFDIHAGGKDLVFPHHENEIAQSQGAHGHGTYARYWMHNGFVNLGGEKMSKSLGNVFNIGDVRKNHDGEAIRAFLLQFHYRSPIALDVEERDGRAVFPGFEEAERRLDYFYSTLQRLGDFFGGDVPASEEGEVAQGTGDLAHTARTVMDDDFNTCRLIAELGEAAKLANKLLDSGKGTPKDVRRRTLARLYHDLRDIAGGALGLLTRDPCEFLDERRARLAALRGIDTARVEEQIAARTAARQAKNFARSDAIRDELTAPGHRAHGPRRRLLVAYRGVIPRRASR